MLVVLLCGLLSSTLLRMFVVPALDLSRALLEEPREVETQTAGEVDA